MARLAAPTFNVISCITGCEQPVTCWGETREGQWRQHGENPEHRRFLKNTESVSAWLLELHDYEAGAHRNAAGRERDG